MTEITEVVYHAVRQGDDGEALPVHRFAVCQGVVRDRMELPWKLQIRNHSRTGLEWGYPGSGPAQLALAIIFDAYKNWRGRQWAIDHARQWDDSPYRAFKDDIVQALPRRGFAITLSGVEVWMDFRANGTAFRTCGHCGNPCGDVCPLAAGLVPDLEIIHQWHATEAVGGHWYTHVRRIG